MSVLFRIVYATHANGTHHKLALDALNDMQRGDKDGWTRLFLKHIERYLEGSKAPDVTFKDFKNHVLHVAEGYWGGAPEKAEAWYRQTVSELKAGNWPEAVYSAGVLSHYYTDPIQPLHTGQTEAENAVHRACEWSINRSYNALRAIGERRFADLDMAVPTGPQWLTKFVCDGAEFSHRYYEKLITHYDINKGAVRPEDGLDPIAQDIVAELLMYASKGFGHVLDAAIAEAGVAAPDVTLTAETFLAATQIPAKFIEKRLTNAEDRKLVQAMYDELRATGRVDKTLTEDDRTVRDLHQREVLAPKLAQRREIREDRIANAGETIIAPVVAAQPIAAAPAQAAPADDMALELAVAKSAQPTSGVSERPPALPDPDMPLEFTPRATLSKASFQKSARSEPSARTSYLHEGDTLEAAPSIGPKTAERFAALGIHTVGDFLAHDPHDMADHLDDAHLDAETLTEWQEQAQLVIDVPGIRGTHAQLLVGAGYRSAEAVAEADPVALSVSILKFAATSEGKRVLREGRPPDIEKIKNWVEVAKQAIAA